ncbi:MAG: restriction endonuclease [Planctomycetes bacterium]|nr:restriction endonuclease [Planctomycetota bacterium]
MRKAELIRMQAWVERQAVTRRQAVLELAQVIAFLSVIGAIAGFVCWLLWLRGFSWVAVVLLSSAVLALLGLASSLTADESQGEGGGGSSLATGPAFCTHRVLSGMSGKRCLVCVGLRNLAFMDLEDEVESLAAEIDRLHRREEERFNREWAAYLRRCANLESLRSMDPFDFEALICRLYVSMGFDAQCTKKSGDKGIDVHASRGGRRLAIQCKRYGYSSVVSGEEVQRLYGAMRQAGSDSAILVTTGRFSPAAVESARSLGVEIVDGESLVKMVMEHLDELSE